jgi:RNA polymerase sigma-70 factor (ECF subfamily)
VDESLHDRLRAAEPNAFDEVYEQFRPGVYRYLVRLCQNRALAEELSQEVWLRFAAHARQLGREVELAAWLFTVARNLYRSQRRRQVLAGHWLHELAGLVGLARPVESPFETLAASRLQRELEHALASLPESHREIVVLVMIEHLTPGEAARVLSINPEAARQRLARARQLLARSLLEASQSQAVRDPT